MDQDEHRDGVQGLSSRIDHSNQLMSMKIRELSLWQFIILIAATVGLILGGVSLIKIYSEPNEIHPEQVMPTTLFEKPTQFPLTPTPTVIALSPTPTPIPSATPTLQPTWTPSPTPIAVITGIYAFGRLETAQYTLRDIVEMEDAPSNVLEALSQDKLLLIAEGEVVAGFDLTKVQDRDIVVIRDTVLLFLPEPEILYSRIDNERTYVYERETGLFRRPDPDLETAARRLAEQQIRNWALERGILIDAEEFGRFYLENFLRSLGFNKIRIEIRQ